MDWLPRANNVLGRVLHVVVIASIVGLTVTMTAQVILRYLLQWSLMGVEEMSTLFGLWLYFAGLALVTVRNRHIRGGFISAFLSERARALMDRVFMVLCALICVYFFVLSVEYTQFVIDVDRRSTFLRWPTAIWTASLNLGLLLSALTLILQVVDGVRRREP